MELGGALPGEIKGACRKLLSQKRKVDPFFCRTFDRDVHYFRDWQALIENRSGALAVRSITTNQYALNRAGRESTGQVSPELPWLDAASRLCAGELRRVEDFHSLAMKTGVSVNGPSGIMTGERMDLWYWMRLGATHEPTRVVESLTFNKYIDCKRGCAVILSCLARRTIVARTEQGKGWSTTMILQGHF